MAVELGVTTGGDAPDACHTTKDVPASTGTPFGNAPLVQSAADCSMLLVRVCIEVFFGWVQLGHLSL